MGKPGQVTLRAYHTSAAPTIVSDRLGLLPTTEYGAGEWSDSLGMERNLNAWIREYAPAPGAAALERAVAEIENCGDAWFLLLDDGWVADLMFTPAFGLLGGPKLSANLLVRIAHCKLPLWLVT